MKMKNLLNIFFIALVFISWNCYPQSKLSRKTVIDFSFNLDSTKIPELDSILPIGLTVHLNDGKMKKTRGLNDGNYSWNNFNIDIENAEFSDGLLHYNNKTVYRAGHQIKLTISPKNNLLLKKEYVIPIPYLTSFQLYNSKKARFNAGNNIPIYIQAQFSNHKLYSSNKRRLDGKLDWHDFQLSLNGTKLKSPNIVLPNPINIYYKNLLIKGQYKLDTSIIADLEIPVTYKDTYNLFFDGRNGKNGRKGKNGFGLHGANGNDGFNGEDGQNGENGAMQGATCAQ